MIAELLCISAHCRWCCLGKYIKLLHWAYMYVFILTDVNWPIRHVLCMLPVIWPSVGIFRRGCHSAWSELTEIPRFMCMCIFWWWIPVISWIRRIRRNPRNVYQRLYRSYFISIGDRGVRIVKISVHHCIVSLQCPSQRCGPVCFRSISYETLVARCCPLANWNVRYT